MHDQNDDIEQFLTRDGRINEARLLRHLYPNRPVSRTKSAPPPDAHSTKPCGPGNDPGRMISRIRHTLEATAGHSDVLHAVTDIMIAYGLRISEVLSIRGTDIDDMCNIYIKGLKGSGNRIISPVQSRAFFQKHIGKRCLVFDCINRFWVYREYKKLGIYEKMSNGYKNSVCHLPRHLLIRYLHASGKELEDIRKFISHESTGSTEYYTGKKKS